jgi:hypothetical protein
MMVVTFKNFRRSAVAKTASAGRTQIPVLQVSASNKKTFE